MTIEPPEDLSVFVEIAGKLDSLETAVLAESDKREKEIVAANDRAAASERAAKESKRKAHNARTFAWVALAAAGLALVAAGFGIAGSMKANGAVDDVIAQRKEGRQSVCNGFESFTNSLILISPAATSETDRAAKQKRVDQFEHDLEKRLGPLGCDLHLIPVPGG